MFNSTFKPAYYFQEEFYLKEKKYLFQELWHLAGMKSCMNLGGNRFYTTSVAGKKVQLREYDGLIYALENVCPHRGGPFIFDDMGDMPLVCKYHGLSFHANGVFKASASADWFCRESPHEELNCLAIKKFRTKEVGEFVFVSLGEEVAFEDQFSDEMIAEMQKLKFHPHYGHAKWEEKFNWKLNFENIKDPLHIYYVHPKTFGHLLAFNAQSYVSKSDQFDNAVINEKKITEVKTLKDMSFMGYSSDMERPKVWWEEDIESLYRENSYVNFYFFPSTNFYSVGGTHFARQTYDPSGPSSFNYCLEVYLPGLTKKINAAPLIKKLLEIEKVVIDEDSVVLKEINESFKKEPQTKMFHGDYEGNIPNQISYLINLIYTKKI